MRTTLRLPDDLFRRVRMAAAERGTTMTAFFEQALRNALDEPLTPIGGSFRIEAFHGTGLLPGVDLDDSAALEDVMAGDADG